MKLSREHFCSSVVEEGDSVDWATAETRRVLDAQATDGWGWGLGDDSRGREQTQGDVVYANSNYEAILDHDDGELSLGFASPSQWS